MDVRTYISKNLRKFRDNKNLTQKELADMLGVTPQAVSKWERSESCPDIVLLPRLSEILDCSINDLFNK